MIELCADFSAVNPGKSSSFNVTHANEFNIIYGDKSSVSGDYFTDDLNLGGASVTAQTMGIAYNTALLSPISGILGIGYDQLEASSTRAETPFVYPSLIDTLVTQGLISTKAYSLYLNDLSASTGALIFGGLDFDKYQGNLVQLPIIPSPTPDGGQLYTFFNIQLSSYGVSTSPGNSTTISNSLDVPVVLDSGTTFTLLPESLVQALTQEIKGVYDQKTGWVFVDCALRDGNPDMTFDYGFGGGSSKSAVVRVPAAELIFDNFLADHQPDIPFNNPCILGIQPKPQAPFILGDVFLRSAYVVYDLKNNLIAIGQTNFNSTTSSILDFPADATTIPLVIGVATSSLIVETATGPAESEPAGIPGLPDLTQTGVMAPSSTAASSSTSRPTVSAGVAPALLDFGSVVIMATSVAFAFLGTGVFFT